MNTQILRLWIIEKITKLQNRMITGQEDENVLLGKISILEELYDDFNLELAEEDLIEFHNQF